MAEACPFGKNLAFLNGSSTPSTPSCFGYSPLRFAIDAAEEHLAVADSAGAGNGADQVTDRRQLIRFQDPGDGHLGQHVEVVLVAGIGFQVALLTAITPDLNRRQFLDQAAFQQALAQHFRPLGSHDASHGQTHDTT